METSLSEQLNRLAVPQASLLKVDKEKGSLLFDKKQAAEISRGIYYQIGLDGYEELKLKCALFIPFQNTLFHATSKEFERSVHNVTVNEKLDKQIKQFFITLSPYLSLPCAHKALEWLIHRYKVHEYNKEDFLMLILPYHETNIFVRALQLIKIKNSDNYFIWLKDIQKAGVHLPKTTLYNHAAKNPQFIKQVGKFVLQALHEHDQSHAATILINFYCIVATGAVEYSNDINEEYVAQTLSILLKGLKSPVPDFCAATYIITAKLLSKIKLSDRILNKFVYNISLLPANQLKTEAILLLAILFQTQPHFSEISESAIRNFANKIWVTQVLGQLNTVMNFVEPLILLFFKKFIEYGLLEAECNKVHAFVLALLNDGQVESLSISRLLSIVLETYEAKRKNISDDIQNWVTNIVLTIENRCPDIFDKEVNRMLRVQPGENLSKMQKCLQKLIVNVQRMRGNVSRFNKLYHPLCDIRKETIKYYIKMYNDLEEEERQLLNKDIMDKLHNDDPPVVLTILCRAKKLLPQIVDKIILRDVLIKLLRKGWTDEWQKVCYPALNILCSISHENDIVTFAAILPFILPLANSDMKIATLIVHSCYFINCKYFKSLHTQMLKETTTADTFFDIVFSHLKTLQLSADELEQILTYYLDQNQCSISKYITVMLMCALLPSNVSTNVSYLILDVLQMHINEYKCIITKSDSMMKDFLILARQNQISIQGILFCIETLIERTDILTYASGDLVCNSNTNVFIVKLLDVLLSGCYTKNDVSLLYASAFKKFVDRVFVDVQAGIMFLLNVCVTNMKETNIILQLRSVRTINALLCTKKSLVFNEIIAAYMLIGMSNKFKEIRRWIMHIVISILKEVNISFPPKYSLLFKNILNYKEEIILDDTQISIIISNIFQDNFELREIIDDLVILINNINFTLYFRGCLANILISINNFEIYNALSMLAVEILHQNQNGRGELNEYISKILYNILLKLTPDYASQIMLSSNSYKMIDLVLQCDDIVLKYSDISVTPSALCITDIHHTFEYFNSDVKLAVLNGILKIAASTSNLNVITALRKFFKHIDLDAKLIVKQLSEMYDTLQQKRNTKRGRRVSCIPTTDTLETVDWKKGIIAVEFLQDKKKIRNSEVLIPLLFKILKKCLDFDEQSNVEYPKQILLSTLLNCCVKLEDKDISENMFNVDVLIQCIRASQNPQTHHHALLVLAHIANSAPKQVLHHIMAIFTFMGSSVLRYDDAYTFQIINRIVDSVIPILIEGRSTSDIVNVLRVFVDAILDVPEHRRMTLYCNLLQKLTAKDNMHLFILLMLEAYVLHINTEKQKVKIAATQGTTAPKRLDITADICRTFSPDIVIENCIKIVLYLQKLPEDKDSIVNIQLPFDITHQTKKQYRHYKYAIITFVSNLLSSAEFISVIANLNDENQQRLEAVCKNMIISTIIYIQNVAKSVDKNKDTSEAHYWKTILHHSYDILDSINGLLTPHMFLLVIRGLTTHSLSHIRRRSLELLNAKLLHDFGFFSECSESEIYAMIPALLNIVKQGESDQNHLTVQTAFLSLKLFIKCFAKDNFEKFIDVLNYLTDFIKSAKVQENILASAVLCLSELCNHLRARAISYLCRFMPTLLKILRINRHQNYPDLLLLSVLTALLKILESLPLFLSSYLEKILYEVSLLLCKWENSNCAKLQPVIGKLKSIKQKIAVLVPFRTLIPAVCTTYNQIIEDKNYSSISALTGILSESISCLSSSEIEANTPELTAFFLNALCFRSDMLTSFAETNDIEMNIINALTTFSLKLSESAFRPVYYKIYNWAIRNETKNERLITLYVFSNDIANHLKSLFVLFAAHILNHAALLLDSCNTVKHKDLYYNDEEKSAILLQFILKTLHTIFLYDTRKFINKERFDILIQPLVDQLENTLGSDNISRAEDLVIPCIVQFAVATADDSCWKQLNYQILLKMRHSSATIRILALKCLLQFATKLGADFLPLLPETIPFLAELLEDESEEVEKICEKTVHQLEKILGEPLQKYF